MTLLTHIKLAHRFLITGDGCNRNKHDLKRYLCLCPASMHSLLHAGLLGDLELSELLLIHLVEIRAAASLDNTISVVIHIFLRNQAHMIIDVTRSSSEITDFFQFSYLQY